MNNQREQSNAKVVVSASQLDNPGPDHQQQVGVAGLDLDAAGLPDSSHRQNTGSTNGRQRVLSCWKEIACFLGKGVRTVQRWEQKHGLPVRRPMGHNRIVLAYPEELASWMGPGPGPVPNKRASPHSDSEHDTSFDSTDQTT